MRIRTIGRHGVMDVALAGLVLSAVGCNGDSNADPEPLPSCQQHQPEQPRTTSPTPTPTGWESEFSEDQLAEYEEALGRWEDYERESQPIWATPSQAQSTLKFFASYFYNEDLMQTRLEDYARRASSSKAKPTVLWSKATRIKGKAVTIQQCVDYRHASRSRERPASRQRQSRLRQREIDLSMPDGYPYLITQTRDAASGTQGEEMRQRDSMARLPRR